MSEHTCHSGSSYYWPILRHDTRSLQPFIKEKSANIDINGLLGLSSNINGSCFMAQMYESFLKCQLSCLWARTLGRKEMDNHSKSIQYQVTIAVQLIAHFPVWTQGTWQVAAVYREPWLYMVKQLLVWSILRFICMQFFHEEILLLVCGFWCFKRLNSMQSHNLDRYPF